MEKKEFCALIDELDKYFNETCITLEKLGISECVFNNHFDNIANILESAIDPENLARKDPLCVPSGSYVFGWLFGEDDINDSCFDADNLYDYIQERYKEHEEQQIEKSRE